MAQLGKVWPTLIREASLLRPDARILALSDPYCDENLHEAISSGALGYVSRDADGMELLQCVRVVSQGGMCFESDSLRRLIAQIPESATVDLCAEMYDLTDR